jgi:prevent-host-death family protein
MSDMKTIKLRTLLRESNIMERAAAGEEILVTRFGKPYVRIVSARQLRSFLGAGKHLGMKEPVSPDPIPESEWKSMA